MPKSGFRQDLDAGNPEASPSGLQSPFLLPASVSSSNPSANQAAEEVRNLVTALKPLPALVFVTRCTMRSRPAAFPNLDRDALMRALPQFDLSISDAVALCRQPGNLESKRAFAETIASDDKRKSQQHRAHFIDKIIYAFAILDEQEPDVQDFLQSASFAAIEAVGQLILDSRKPDMARNALDPFDAAVPAVAHDLIKLTHFEHDDSIDPTNGGPLNGLWQSGAPKCFLDFERAFPFKLRLRRKSFPATIPPHHLEQETSQSRGGRAAEPPLIGMDVKSSSEKKLQNRNLNTGLELGASGQHLNARSFSSLQIGLGCQQVPIEFATVEERDRAIEMTWDTTGPLFRLAYDVEDGTTLRVPAPSLGVFALSGLRFKISHLYVGSECFDNADLIELDRELMPTHPSPWMQDLSSYHSLCALTFKTVEERDHAIEMTWDTAGPLFRLPYDVEDGTTLVVPQQAVDFYTRQGLNVIQKRFLSTNP
jgi:hypothetical protein